MKVVGKCESCGGNLIDDPEDRATYCLQCARRSYNEPPLPLAYPTVRRHRERAIGSDHVGDGNQRKRERAREGLEP